MKDALSKRFKAFKDWLNPSNQDDTHNDDDFYPGRRAVKRRQRGLAIRRHLILFAGLVVFLVVVGTSIWGFTNISHSSKVDTLQTRIDHLYTDNSKSELKDSVTQTKLTTIKNDVDDLKNQQQAKKLHSEQTLAQNAFTITLNYDQLFNSKKLVGSKVTVKDVDKQLHTLKDKKVLSTFRDTYTTKLKSVRTTVVTANKLEKRYRAIIDARANNQAVSDATISDLIKDMGKNLKSQKTVTQQKKLNDLKATIKKENTQAEKDAQAAATAAEQAAAAQAAQQAAAAASSSMAAATSSYTDGTTSPYSSGSYTGGSTGSYTNGYYGGTNAYNGTTGTASGY